MDSPPNFLRKSPIDDLRKLVVNLALPASSLYPFGGIDLKPAYLIVFGIIFSLCLLLLGLGCWLKQRFHVPYLYFPFLTTGFEYGMLGVSYNRAQVLAYGVGKSLQTEPGGRG